MLRILTRLRSCPFSNTPVESRKQRKPAVASPKSLESIESQNVAKLYLEFEALPTDPLTIIKQRFIRKKQLL
jgi:hypothetical protein